MARTSTLAGTTAVAVAGALVLAALGPWAASPAGAADHGSSHRSTTDRGAAGRGAAALRLVAPAATAPDVGSRKAPSYQTNGVVWALAYADGVVYAGGSFTAVRPDRAAPGTDQTARAGFAAFDATTGALLPCDPGLTSTTGTPEVHALTASPDGSTLYLGGDFDTAGGVADVDLAALDTSSCTVPAGFTAKVGGTVRAIALNAGSALYVGGDFHDVDGVTRNLAAAVDPDSGALQAFDPDAVTPAGSTRYTAVRAITVSPDDTQVVLGGDFDSLGGVPAHRIAVVDATTGAVVRTFPGLISSVAAVKALTHDAIRFYLGSEGMGGGQFDGRAAVDWSTGRVIRFYLGSEGMGGGQFDGGTLFSGSHAHSCPTTPGGFPAGYAHHLLAQQVTDGQILPWFPNTNGGTGEGLGPRALAMTPAGELWVGGEFTRVDGIAQQGLARFATKPDATLPAAPTPTVVGYGRGHLLVAVRTVADSDQGRLAYGIYRNGTLVHVATVDSTFFSRPEIRWVDKSRPGSHVRYRVVLRGPSGSRTGAWVRARVPTRTGRWDRAVRRLHPSAYWPLSDRGSTFGVDEAGSDPLWQPAGGATYRVTGVLGPGGRAVRLGEDRDAGARAFQGDNQLRVPGTVTEQVWFETTSRLGGTLVGFGTGSRGNGAIGSSSRTDRLLYLSRAGHVVLGAYDGPSGARIAIASPRRYDNGRWHLVDAVVATRALRLYVDGRLVASRSLEGTRSYLGYWTVGTGTPAGWPDAPAAATFTGDLQDVAIFPRALTPAQVASLQRLATALRRHTSRR